MNSRFIVANPCSKKWSDLPGEGRERHCEVCRTSVHAIAQYSSEEWDQIWRESGGRVCALLTGESPPEPRSRRAVLAGALLTAISPLMAQTGRVRIRVTDASGAVITKAEASLLGADGKPIREAHTNEAGEIILTDLPFGDCLFSVDAVTATSTNGDELRLEIGLEVGSVGGPMMVETESEKMRSTLAPPPKRAKRRRWLIF